ncbi:spore coat protein A [Halalkalibacter wakoensis JCM 9140]|uniref:Spore coat protein A n=1 Tax=Halalkalibacter wakoensis JCM 9140 TaxID=1236970 RepID=W4PYT0_9BACI|nr:multicopper oxidase [Halalkalibacter wakoensis]GAE24845.1 spore coat protein A [Halalkalibacter wakoensis JCM 9140]
MRRKLEKFVDSLPIMETLQPKTKGKNYYEVKIQEFKKKLHRDLPPTTLWGYNAQFPGPTIEANSNEPVEVKWINELPNKHFLPVDWSIMNKDLPEVRHVTHLHGGRTPWVSDGYPEAWYTKDYKEVGSFFKEEVYRYLNEQRAMMLWYHDHTMGITRLNNYAGLAGAYIIRDKHEKSLNLPEGEYEVPLIIQDRTFNEDGSLFYPTGPEDGGEDLPNPSIVPAFLGDTVLVNGKVWPYLEVEPRKYRFRILNGSNTRSYQLHLDSNQEVYQIGSDGGLLEKPVQMNKIPIESSERIDVIIDFSQCDGDEIVLKNDLGPDADAEDETNEIMKFKVSKPLKEKDTSVIPKRLSTIRSLRNNKISTHRNLKLVGSTDDFGRPLLLLNNKKWADPTTEKPKVGDTEVWSFINTTDFAHPMHIHLIHFQVLDRQPFDLERYNHDGTIIYTGPPRAPEPNERGWKDTVSAPAGQITRVIGTFAPYTGNYVWHCHILEHEDHDMMRPMKVIDPKQRKDKS